MDKKKEQYLLALEKKQIEKDKQKLEEEAKKLTKVKYKYKLLVGITEYCWIESPTCTAVAVTRSCSDLPYFHHGCDWVNDFGWGRGYRVLQIMCKYVLIKLERHDFPVPCIRDIQKILVRSGDKPKSFERSQIPIGAKEAMVVLATLFNQKAKLIETTGALLKNHANTFDKFAGFGLLSTNDDADCRGICGVFSHFHPRYFCLLLIDTSYNGVPKDNDELRKKGYVYWKRDSAFEPDKSISICCPSI